MDRRTGGLLGSERSDTQTEWLPTHSVFTDKFVPNQRCNPSTARLLFLLNIFLS